MSIGLSCEFLSVTYCEGVDVVTDGKGPEDLNHRERTWWRQAESSNFNHPRFDMKS